MGNVFETEIHISGAVRATGQSALARAVVNRMAESTRHRLSELERVLGRSIRGVYRVFHEHEGVLDTDDGPLEVRFTDGTILLLETDADGETLRVQFSSWVDPFAGPLTDENRRYVQEFGRWRRVECSNDPDYAWLLGRAVTGIVPLENEFGRFAGLAILAGEETLWFTVSYDESRVHLAQPLGFRRLIAE